MTKKSILRSTKEGALYVNVNELMQQKDVQELIEKCRKVFNKHLKAMKTLQEIKTEIIKEVHGNDMTWDKLPEFFRLNLLNKIAKRYAEQCLREAAYKATTKKTGNSGSWYDASVDKESILSLIKELK